MNEYYTDYSFNQAFGIDLENEDDMQLWHDKCPNDAQNYFKFFSIPFTRLTVDHNKCAIMTKENDKQTAVNT